MPEAVLFDLDGTLIDTAPDMGGALNNLLIEENLPPLPLAAIRPYVSQGGLVLTRLGFAGQVAEAELVALMEGPPLQRDADVAAIQARPRVSAGPRPGP